MEDYRSLFEKKHYKDVISICRKAVENGTASEDQLDLLNESYFAIFEGIFEQKEFLRAANWMAEYLEMFPNYLRAHVAWADAVAMAGEQYADGSLIEMALKVYETSIECNFEPSHCIGVKARLLIHIGRMQNDKTYIKEAIIVIEKVISLGNASEADWNNLGLAYVEIGIISKKISDFDQAIQTFTQAAQLFPSQPQVWGNLGLANQGKAELTESLEGLEEAEKYIVKSQKMAPGLSFNFYNLGLNYSERGRIHESRDEWDKAFPAYLRALDEFAKAIAIDSPRDSYGAKGWVYERLARKEKFPYLNEALRHYLKAYSMKGIVVHWHWGLTEFLLSNFNMPNFVAKFILEHPFIYTSSKRIEELNQVQQVYLQYRNLQSQIYKELKVTSKGTDLRKKFILYRALTEHLGGDPITAFNYHDSELNTLWENNLRHQYYYLLNAENILCHETEKIKNTAVRHAKELLSKGSGTREEGYYAACILMLNGEYSYASRVMDVIRKSGYWPAAFRLIECYQVLEKKNETEELARWIHQEGYRNKMLQSKEKNDSAIHHLELLIQQEEAYSGWFIMERLISDKEDAGKVDKIPRSRLMYSWEDNQKGAFQYPNPSIAELLEMDPEKKKELEDLCKERMADVFSYIEKQIKPDQGSVAEYLYSHMLGEIRETGKIIFPDYTALLRYCYIQLIINKEQYLMISLYLNLKFLVLDKSSKGLTIKNIMRNTVSTIITPMLLLLSETTLSVPISLISKIILDSSEKDTDEIKSMNFDYFQRYYSQLKGFSVDKLNELLKNHKKYDELKNLLESLYKFVV